MIEPVVSREWWQAHRDEVVLADVRKDVPGLSAAEAYDQGHLPGAVFVDLERWLAAPPSDELGRHPLPTPEVFAEGMAQAGVGDDDTVIACDDAGGVVAARLVWMLRVTGHEAALLDGGAGDDPLVRDAVTRPRARFTARPWPVADLADLADAADPRNVVVDARPGERFRGAPDPLDPRPGHIPGARSVPCRESLDEHGRLLPMEVLRRRFTDAGVTDGSTVVSYCGSGVTACHNLLVMEQVGLGRGQLYPGSWSQYAADPKRPVEL